MAKHVFAVFTSATEGDDQEFNRWYDEQHVHDVTRVPGIVACQRYKILSDLAVGNVPTSKYLAIYELETDDPAAVYAEITARSGTEVMPNTETMDLNHFGGMIAVASGPRIESK